jgi:NAD(P)-dependent dehydrogenase (short-subunit alcohol dehydrogenase family)
MQKPTPSSRRVILVTGASRGIGAEVAHQLADTATHVIVNYREKAKRANAVVDAIRDRGGSASAMGADLANHWAAAAMIDDIAEQCGRLDALVLNASGGLERGASPDYAMRLNRDAQLRLTRLALPLMRRGGRIIFVTSHQAHFYPQKPVPQDYVPIALSKRAGEDGLRKLQPEFDRRGITLTVVSGDMIDGTIIVRLLQRRDPAAVQNRRARAALPSVDEFAAAIVSAAITPDQGSGTVYVGGADYLWPAGEAEAI